MKDFMQNQLSYLIEEVKKGTKLNSREKEGYTNTILSYKSKLHNAKDYNLFAKEVFNEYARQKALHYWTDYQYGKRQAINDIRVMIMIYSD